MLEKKYCTVKFEGSNTKYDFLNLSSNSLYAGCIVVVRLTNKKLAFATVVDAYSEKGKSNDIACVIERLDLTYAINCLEEFEKQDRLMQKMEERAKQLEKLSRFKQLAEDDEKMKELYNRYMVGNPATEEIEIEEDW